jgi:hypothetical protein
MENLKTHSHFLVKLLKGYNHAVGCEIGVHTGSTASLLLAALPGIKIYHAVDPWESYEQYDGTEYKKPSNKVYKKWKDAKLQFIARTNAYKKTVIHQMTSVEAVKKFKDNSLDWIFIDANHQYEYIKENLRLWTPKVKKGGIVSGHDYGSKKYWGIKKAVDEFFPEDKLHVAEKFLVWWVIK